VRFHREATVKPGVLEGVRLTRERDKYRSVLVIIPAWNEAGTIRDIVRRVRRRLPGAAVLVIDDGSSDRTGQAARSAGAQVARMPYNLGIGGAVQAGYRYAMRRNFEIVIRLDGDGQHLPEEIPVLLETMDREWADVVVGSRFVAGTGYHAPLARRLGMRLFAWLASSICGQRLTDTTSGFRAARRLAVAHMAQMHASDYPEIESLVTLFRSGFGIAEAPVRMNERAAGNSSIGVVQAFYYVAKVLLAVLVTVLAAPRCTRMEMLQRRRIAERERPGG